MSDHDIQIKKQIYKCQTMIYKLKNKYINVRP
jgi:hypothetical protein